MNVSRETRKAYWIRDPCAYASSAWMLPQTPSLSCMGFEPFEGHWRSRHTRR